LQQLSSQWDEWVERGTISAYQSLNQYLPSIHQQSSDFELIRSLYQSQSDALQTSLQLKNKPSAQQPFSPITVDNYLSSKISDPTRFLWLGEYAGSVYTIVKLTGTTDTSYIKEWVSSRNDVKFLDKTDEISTLFGEYRIKITELLALALVVIWLVLGWRFSFKQSCKMVAPSIIAAICALAVTVATGTAINLFNLLALALILGIGIDYTLFFAQPRQHKSTLLAVTLSAITTTLSFGLLALSNTHAIHSFGITVLTGIFVTWLLSPMAMVSPPQGSK
jgi:predicted exporter